MDPRGHILKDVRPGALCQAQPLFLPGKPPPPASAYWPSSERCICCTPKATTRSSRTSERCFTPLPPASSWWRLASSAALACGAGCSACCSRPERWPATSSAAPLDCRCSRSCPGRIHSAWSRWPPKPCSSPSACSCSASQPAPSEPHASGHWWFDLEPSIEVEVAMGHEVTLRTHLGGMHQPARVHPELKPDRRLGRAREERHGLRLHSVEHPSADDVGARRGVGICPRIPLEARHLRPAANRLHVPRTRGSLLCIAVGPHPDGA